MELTDLLEFEEIKRVKYAYMRCIDQKRWDELAETFAADATSSYGDGKFAFQGRELLRRIGDFPASCVIGLRSLVQL